ncbi:MAG: type II toxin-antitoxin system HicA family toxin [Bryobacteraceae bacterium]
MAGDELAAALCRNWGYTQVHQVGSHAILETETPSHQRIAIPMHRPLRIGTLNAILRAVATHQRVRREEILRLL